MIIRRRTKSIAMKSTIVKLIQFQFHPVPAEPTLKLILFNGPKKKTEKDPIFQAIWNFLVSFHSAY